MQVGTVIYLRHECQNWKQYQIPVEVIMRDKNSLGQAYITKMEDGTHVYCWASDYFAGKKEIAVKKTPWKDLPVFHTAEEIQEFVSVNLLKKELTWKMSAFIQTAEIP